MLREKIRLLISLNRTHQNRDLSKGTILNVKHFMFGNRILFMVKVDDLAACRRCGNVYARHIGILAVVRCPSCSNASTPDYVEL